MRIAFAVVAAMLAASAVPVQAGVTVTFVQPERYRDATDSGRSLKDTVAEVEKILKALGERYIPAQETLRIEVLDIDLAGRAAGVKDRRLLDGVGDWPTFKLRYTLGAAATPVEES